MVEDSDKTCGYERDMRVRGVLQTMSSNRSASKQRTNDEQQQSKSKERSRWHAGSEQGMRQQADNESQTSMSARSIETETRIGREGEKYQQQQQLSRVFLIIFPS